MTVHWHHESFYTRLNELLTHNHSAERPDDWLIKLMPPYHGHLIFSVYEYVCV